MKSIQSLPFVSLDDCESLGIGSKDVIDSLEYYIRGAAEGWVYNAPKASIAPGDGRYMMATLCAAETPPIMAVKSLLVSPDNSSRGLENINAAVTLHDSISGVPLGVIDGNWVTAVRTAGLSAVAAKYLARENSTIATFIGCGVQASSHLQMFSDMFALSEIRAVGRGEKNRDRLCAEATALGIRAVPFSSSEAAIDGADLVITSLPISYSGAQFIDAGQISAGAFCTVTDLALPWKADTMSQFDRLIIDNLEQERKMPTPMVDPALVGGDITQLVSGAATGRQTDAEKCAFVFRGLALGDLAIAALAWQRYANR
jgi:ornithine cyclodeaminase/alanine dehydrogenase-like protein (mu-crystallin family)